MAPPSRLVRAAVSRITLIAPMTAGISSRQPSVAMHVNTVSATGWAAEISRAPRAVVSSWPGTLVNTSPRSATKKASGAATSAAAARRPGRGAGELVSGPCSSLARRPVATGDGAADPANERLVGEERVEGRVVVRGRDAVHGHVPAERRPQVRWFDQGESARRPG